MNSERTDGGREEILRRLRNRARPAEHPKPWHSRRSFSDQAARFEEALTAAKGSVRRAPDLETALAQLGQFLEETGARRIVANDHPSLADLDLPARFPGYRWHIAGRDEGELRQFAATADVGLSSADAALAETGTIVLSSGPGRSRMATLLPPIHAALVPADRLTTDIFTWAAERPAGQPSNLIFISGPSKTADIEQTLAVGVHGPKQLIVFLY